jgi:group I intron endonuclease
VYKTTNKINGKYYIGVHKTSNPLDDYLGSGRILKRAVEKHGVENFTKEILATFDSPEEAFRLEAELVTFELVHTKECYNAKEGGIGGFDHLNDGSESHRDRSRLAMNKALANMESKKIGVYSETYISPFSNRKIQQLGNSPEGRAKAKVTVKKTYAEIQHQQGQSNSNFGKCWITKDSDNKSVKKEDLTIWLDQGWVKGRKLKMGHQ